MPPTIPKPEVATGPKAPVGLRHRLRLGGQRPLVASLVALLALYGGALFVLRPASPGAHLTLDKLVQATIEKRVASATLLDEDRRVTGRLRAAPGGTETTEFWTAIPRSDAATNDLLRTFFSNGTTVDINSQSSKSLVRFVAQFLLPLVILANLFALLFTLTRSSSPSSGSELIGFSRISDRRVGARQKESTTFANVAAASEAIVELAEVRDYLADPRAFAAMGALPPKGVLLVGPPGCGKTLMARAVAGEAQASFFSLSGSEFVESLVGVGAARVRDLFAQARAAAPSILFIDELDAVGRQRGAGLGGGHDEREQTLNELLVQMDGFSPSEGVAVLAATNRPDILDAALLRPGRFDRHITVERPDVAGRRAILALHASSKRLSNPAADLDMIARRTPGFTGADLASVLNEAALLAVRGRAASISQAHLEEAVERVIGGPRRAANLIPEAEKLTIAYHEAGHAVVAAALGMAAGIEKMSVVSRGRGVGHVSVLTERSLLRRSDMEAQVAIAMGGVAAEELVFGEPSVGAEADLERATNTARDMAGRYGMSSRLGRVRVLKEQREVFLGRDYLTTRDVSQPTLEHLDSEVRRILDEQEAVARTVLTSNRKILDNLAEALAVSETLQGAELAELLAATRAHSGNVGTDASVPRSTRTRAGI